VNRHVPSRRRLAVLKFGIVRPIGAIVDFGGFNLLTSLLGCGRCSPVCVSFTAAVTSNCLEPVLGLRIRDPSPWPQAEFAAVNLAGLLSAPRCLRSPRRR
jgi:hypothetical protein